MSQAKKQAGSRVLQSLGMSASQAINELYDYLIAQRAMPFTKADDAPTVNGKLEDALRFVRSIPRKNSFSDMNDEQIKRAKLASKGFVASDREE